MSKCVKERPCLWSLVQRQETVIVDDSRRVSLREKGRERKRERGRERKREEERKNVRDKEKEREKECSCVRERERERERPWIERHPNLFSQKKKTGNER